MENKLVENTSRKTRGRKISQTCRKQHNKEKVRACVRPTADVTIKTDCVRVDRNLLPWQRKGAMQAFRSSSDSGEPSSLC